MEPTRHPRVKICCIQNSAEARLAIRHGAAALGLVSAMPSGPGVISEEQIAAIASHTPPGVATFLLTSKQEATAVIAQQRRCGTNTIQLVDALQAGTYADLRRALPGIKLVQVIHVTGEQAIDAALQVAPHVDAILLDSGNPHLAVKELGGTGRTHNWRISRMIRAMIDVPLYLAGGLHAGNVQQAIAEVGPFGLDLCSGVRTNGTLDERKLEKFFEKVRTS
ncbi:MAG: phosphoribosylanthranilate isomerase [candidate division KSB1 bacterium]|nr:phosphoribosylanthranilate isomerase [candidate division KSB1 bacterium]MDZ7273911.1 phosphoribosylanthranilate isomerase [candidate division KSB1 bacterium]MDZ7286067.1 phosphoribosylanthranilate isomerase [candidate division KSB1 bacterium]MDZ7299099.1 phosphoribosylanthranilate isomerase [candidate division KSB1 bacterium]MDZ7306402.1 phosphoribosylanthranilate isomerase [candidate division KSB1 bacterium]